MSFQQEYRQKLVSPREAVKLVKSGDRIQFNSYNGVPPALDRALAARRDELEGVIVSSSVTMYPLYTISSDPEGKHFIYNNWHASGYDRKLAPQGNYYYVPALYYEFPRILARNSLDVVMLQVGEMDDKGNMNFGPSAAHARILVEAGRKVIVEVNRNMPVAYGGSDESVHISEIDLVVEGDHDPLFTLPVLKANKIDRKIADLLMNEIEDGACIQLGIGAMPNTVGELIADSDLQDLGVHTEMLADAHVKMYQSGRISGKNKGRDKGKMVYGFAMGSQELYRFIHRNPACATYSIKHINTPHIIAMNPKVIAINSAIEVDLYSQINSESSGFRHISGTGGQVDFMLGSYMSEGGKGFICMSSTFTDKEGKLSSRILPTLSPGSIVTVPRTIAQYIVTEYGIANVKGKSTWERAEELIKIAHPRFQDELVKSAAEMNIWRRSNKL
ncbi:Acetyl-CoA hydrolase/transferase [Syntrophomonas zehnderi OL-4]|uniref:Probable butyrate:acetyl-CoA coenzyme A-transferase n=1 Tax=Syntrophomonas zehnderi OL-4 TaxID=690567 RepID=A0A0E4GCX2_9FIRM|nr:acetyl-CoA hydrolase/transferase C-terminal domain-containing protein [Syntrophomonas zehnderi]CFX28433.1 Acetyl-CoA hydrolase/transferase [Syntrophomonas zehnderi OL-4]